MNLIKKNYVTQNKIIDKIIQFFFFIHFIKKYQNILYSYIILDYCDVLFLHFKRNRVKKFKIYKRVRIQQNIMLFFLIKKG